MTKTQAKKISELLASIEIDVWADDLLDIELFDDLSEFLADNGYFDVEIIYYSRAIEYLAEHDPSLQESLEIAEDMGYTPGKLSSEILASLLASQRVREEYQELVLDIEEILT